MAQSDIMSGPLNTLSNKMARQRRHKQEQPRVQLLPRIELLPVELQLIILENVCSVEDLNSLILSSPTYRATFHAHKKTVLAHVLQATLGDAFIEACMVQHWQSNLNNYEEDERDSSKRSMIEGWLSGFNGHETTHGQDNESETNHAIPVEPWPQGPYRHIQLKFLHDYDQHAMVGAGDQVRNMKRLLAVQDFEQIMSFYTDVMQPISSLFGDSITPEQDYYDQHGLFINSKPQRRTITVTERQRIMRTLYRYQMCCRLYGPHVAEEGGGAIDMGDEHRQMMVVDFFERFDAMENEEFDVVYTGLAFVLHKAFERIKYNSAWKSKLRERALTSFAENPWVMQDYDVFSFRPIGLRGVTAGTLSMGLELLAKIQKSAAVPYNVVAMLVARDPPELVNWMWDALLVMPGNYNFSGEWPESWTDEFWQ
jgi:hypothetical protein